MCRLSLTAFYRGAASAAPQPLLRQSRIDKHLNLISARAVIGEGLEISFVHGVTPQSRQHSLFDLSAIMSDWKSPLCDAH